MPLVVGAHEADDDDVALLSLKAVDGVHGDAVAQRPQGVVAAHQLSQVLHLRAVGRDDGHVEVLVEHALAPDALHIAGERGDGELRLGTVDAPIAVAHHFLLAVEVTGVNPCDGRFPVEDAAVTHLWGALHL